MARVPKVARKTLNWHAHASVHILSFPWREDVACLPRPQPQPQQSKGKGKEHTKLVRAAF